MPEPNDCICACSFLLELIFLLHKMSKSFLEPSVKLFLYQQVCMTAYQDDTNVCHHLKHYPTAESTVQHAAAKYNMYFNILVNCQAIVLGLFCGAWSDRVGRKLPMVLPCVGTTLGTLIYISGTLPNWPTVILILVGGTVEGLFGRSPVITMAIYSYSTDTSNKDQRTGKIGKLMSVNFFGLFFGSLLAGLFLDLISFAYVFCIIMGINVTVVMLVLIFLKESVPGIEDGREPNHKRSGSTNPLNPSNFRDTLKALFSPRKNRGRCHLLLLFLAVILNHACKSGELDITMLFVQRRPLSWSKSLFGYYLATSFVLSGLGLLLLPFLCSKVLRLKDSTLVILGTLSRIGQMSVVAFSDQTWMVFTAAAVGCLSPMVVCSSKSLISKSVSQDEIGKVFSLLSCCEAGSNLLGTVLLTMVYTATFEIHAGATFLVEGGIYCFLFIMFLWLCWDMRVQEKVQLADQIAQKRNYNSVNPRSDSLDRCVNSVNNSDPSHPVDTILEE